MLAFFIILQSVQGYSQKSNFSYKPENVDSLKAHIAAVTDKKAMTFEGKHKKEISKLLLERKESFIGNINDSTYIFDKRINNHLKSILREIYATNKELDTRDYYFLVDKSPVPNAACYGNGIFTINLGLLELMENDDEIGFVICHEIAHLTLKHSDKSIVKHIETMANADTKKRLNKAAASRNGKRQAVYAVLEDLTYNFMKRSRDNETQADSLGMIYFNRTKYNKAAAITALKKLESSDVLLFTTNTNIRKHFDFESYPFKEQWLAADETLFDIDEKVDDLSFNKDSLKTHPDIPLRIARLGTLPDSNISGAQAYLAVKKIAAENTISIALDISKIDLALYQLLALREKNEISLEMYCNNVGGLLKKAYELKASHRFGKYVNPVSPFDDEKYLNEVRLFLHNTEMKNLRKIGMLFCQKHENEMKGDAEFQKLSSYFKSLNI